jgi:hypothetical protein
MAISQVIIFKKELTPPEFKFQMREEIHPVNSKENASPVIFEDGY